MTKFHFDFTNSFFSFQIDYYDTFYFSTGIKRSSQKYGWRSIGWDKKRGWWKWRQAIPV